ncbi:MULTISPECIES: DUF6049 family protein [Cryobacterium]|uniref:Uncharacterized protein n=1 Tax=Cryobacterium breve TaxID=1259258 RepID=A0ABY2IU13_9MICO|nr:MULTISPECIES: DUF6049 family protein [Cryobacterium]TFC94832.1 hypothetical protein E3O65_16285 [Cryobacterium breve]TFC94962.1 hypothetical protein E3T20_06895 [Cryobacterium sp. TmT3-12]
MPLRAVLAALLAGVVPLAIVLPASAATVATAAQASQTVQVAAAASANEVSITVAHTTMEPLRADQDLTVTVTIDNATSDTIAPGTIDLYLAERALISRTALNSWLSPEKSGKSGDLMLTQPLTASIQPDSTEIFTLTVPADSVGLTSGNAWGARGIAATLTAGDTVRAEGRGTFVWYSNEEVTPANLAVIMPITVPTQSTGLITGKALETYTSPSGVLSRQLDGVAGKPVTIAIDPQIIVSIRILGSAAPASAVEWLDRLDQAPNDIFPLSYADADLSLQAQSGAITLLAPSSFDQAIDPALFAATDQNPAPTDTSDPSGAPTDAPTVVETPTPTDEPATPSNNTPPTMEELLAWEYSATDIGWPAEGDVAANDLDVFTASGLSTTILGGANTSGAASDFTPNSAVDLGAGNGQGLVIDDDIADALRAAAMATSDDAWREAMAEVSSQLAVVSAERPGTARTLLATFDRGWPPNASRLGQTIDALSTLLWYAPSSLPEVRASAPADEVTFDSLSEPADRVDQATRLLERESDVLAFSAALSSPGLVTGTQRLDLMALLSNSWAAQDKSWSNAVGNSLAASSKLLDSITVATKGPINVVGSQVDIPVTLDNALDQAVTVMVQVVPSNGRLLVGDAVESTIEAQSARTVTIPVTAAVGNGAVTLRVTLLTPTGSVIQEPSLIPINVRADWEGLGALLFAAFVVLFFGFGVWRNILRRRRERADPEQIDPEPSDAGPTGSEPADAESSAPRSPMEPRG